MSVCTDAGRSLHHFSVAGHELLHACDQAKRVVPGGEDLAPGLSLPVYAPLRSAQSRRPPDVVRPSSRLIAPQIPRPAPSATTRVCSTPTALLKNAIQRPPLSFPCGSGGFIAAAATVLSEFPVRWSAPSCFHLPLKAVGSCDFSSRQHGGSLRYVTAARRPP